MAIISTPENMKNLEHYREISQKLALAKGLTDDQAKALAGGGKRSSGSTAACTRSETVERPAACRDYLRAELKDDPRPCASSTTTSSSALANPDGMELVSSWYMRNPTPPSARSRRASLCRSTSATMKSRLLASNRRDNQRQRILSRVWYPQIVYNHHQAGPAGTVIFNAALPRPQQQFL